MTRSLRSRWDAPFVPQDELKHAPTLGVVKMKQAGRLTDALPVVWCLASKLIVGAGFDFGFGLGLADEWRRALPSPILLPLALTACTSGR